MAEVILITGGARSGKSAEALRLTDGFARRVFVATAEAFDEEMRHRIERHQAERGEGWETLEEPLDLAGALRSLDDPRAAVVIDCLTVWLGNLMHHDPHMAEDAPRCAALVEALRRSCAGRVIVVTNEVGMGLVPEHALSRRYRDVAGRLTQCIAAMAEQVVLMVCGQPLTVKPAPRREGSHD
jgi:adenosylcobinamide kinase/adenosylcobinamide-phosphate guanylyltransferase